MKAAYSASLGDLRFASRLLNMARQTTQQTMMALRRYGADVPEELRRGQQREKPEPDERRVHQSARSEVRVRHGDDLIEIRDP